MKCPAPGMTWTCACGKSVARCPARLWKRGWLTAPSSRSTGTLIPATWPSASSSPVPASSSAVGPTGGEAEEGGRSALVALELCLKLHPDDREQEVRGRVFFGEVWRLHQD